MEAESFQLAVDDAINRKLWLCIYMYGCGTFVIKPTAVDTTLLSRFKVEGEMLIPSVTAELGAPTPRELQQGQAMKERLRQLSAPNVRPVSLLVESSDVKAVVTYLS